jgi:putative DNA primase/helicase
MTAYSLTDAGNALRFAHAHREWLCYCYSSQEWLSWMRTHWASEPGVPMRLGKQTALGIYEEAKAAPIEEQRKATAKWAITSESERHLNAMVALAKCELEVKAEALDADPSLLNVQNGTVDLHSGTLRPHRREDLITKVLPIPYDPEATCPRWLAFLTRIFDGRPELTDFLQRAIGYSLTGDTRERCFFILWGGGDNGKSTLIETIAGLLGPYAQTLDMDSLLAKHADVVALNDLFTVKGARFVSACEPDMGRALAESRVKRLTGQDTIKAKKLYTDLLAYRPTFKLYLATNHRPMIRGTDHAIWNRVRLIPFTVSIPKAEQDLTLPAQLRAEWPGILAWAIQGCLAWQRDGLGLPDEVRTATDTYRAEMDVLGGFLRDTCVLELNASIAAGELYQTYESWGHKQGEKTISATAFGLRVAERGFAHKRTRAGRFWLGLRLRTAMDTEMDDAGMKGCDATFDKVPYAHLHGDFLENTRHRPTSNGTPTSSQPEPDWVTEDFGGETKG